MLPKEAPPPIKLHPSTEFKMFTNTCFFSFCNCLFLVVAKCLHYYPFKQSERISATTLDSACGTRDDHKVFGVYEYRKSKWESEIAAPVIIFDTSVYASYYGHSRICVPNLTAPLVRIFQKCAVVAVFLPYHFSQVSKSVIKYYWVREPGRPPDGWEWFISLISDFWRKRTGRKPVLISELTEYGR